MYSSSVHVNELLGLFESGGFECLRPDEVGTTTSWSLSASFNKSLLALALDIDSIISVVV